MKKKIVFCFAIAFVVTMSSFVIYKTEHAAPIIKIKGTAFTAAANINTTTANVNMGGANDWEKVYAFVDEQVVQPIEKADKKTSGKSKVDYFSRCPSGMEPSISSDSVKVDRYVYGKVNNWRGCKATGICVFRVNVKNKVAQVRELKTKEFMTVSAWIEKKYPKEIKG